MPFLNKLSSFAQNAVDNTKSILEINRLNSAASGEKSKIAEWKEKIGEYYWGQYSSGAVLDEEPAGFCEEIKACENRIASIEAEIQTKKEEAQKAAQMTQTSSAPEQQGGTVICQNCGAANPATSKFCKECGGKLEAPTADKPLVCTACGAQNPPGTKFCSSCGNKLS